MKSVLSILTLALCIGTVTRPATAAGDPAEGARDFRACASCHSIEPDRNMTGPSLSGLIGRKAGALKSFERYSPALKESSVVWNAQTLDAWLSDPAHFIANNRMTFPGIKDPKIRADLIAYLEAVSSGNAPQVAQQDDMGGMMGGGDVPDLKSAGAAAIVKSIRYCRDTYSVTTEDGKVHDFWERNLRLKTDSGDHGPQPGAPALIPAGMMGDRADIIFAKPEEIGVSIKQDCSSVPN